MCLTCGCLFGGKGNRLRFKVEGYTPTLSDTVKKQLLGLPGVYAVHIHTKDGETTINYDHRKITINELLAVFTQHGLKALI